MENDNDKNSKNINFLEVQFGNDIKLCKKHIFKNVETFQNNDYRHLNGSPCMAHGSPCLK